MQGPLGVVFVGLGIAKVCENAVTKILRYVSTEPRHRSGAAFLVRTHHVPELFRIGVEELGLFMIIASWPSARQTHWDILLRARAIENQCFVIGVNRVGGGGGHSFAGGSVVIDPLGRVMDRGGEEETLIIADLDPAMVGEVRETLPFLRDRKT